MLKINDDEDFFKSFAKDISSAEKLKEFEKAVNDEFKETGDIDVILAALKVLAVEQGNIAKLARNSKVERTSIYNMFKKGSNPTFENLNNVSRNLGVEINFSFGHIKK
jgi:probable addiction module antidote protein